jgi:hypothetical protein
VGRLLVHGLPPGGGGAGQERSPEPCFFADRGQRGAGVASAALAGALEEIGRQGGGTIESYPDEVDGRSVSASFLHNGTVAMFERQGFERTRRIGKTRWVVRKSLG